MDGRRYAEVVVNAPIGKTLHYSVPGTLSAEIGIGKRVKVPLGNRLVSGYCVGLTDSPADISVKKIKGVVEVQDSRLAMAPAMLSLTQQISRRYHCPWSDALAVAFPSAIKKGHRVRKTKALRLVQGRDEIKAELAAIRKRAPRQAKALRVLLEAEDGIPVRELSRLSGCSSSSIQTLVRRKLVELYELDPGENGLTEGRVPKSPHLPLTTEQRNALDLIRSKLAEDNFGVVLLQGVTGSGKTEVYLQAISEVVRKNLGAIVLVPEVSLTPQTIERFSARFDNVSVLHSYLTGAEHRAQWQAIREGISQVVIGARSAVFAPLKRLGLVVVDEEHESTYKQDNSPRYHARDVAIMRAKEDGAVVILGSATPSLESYFNALLGNYSRAVLSKRIGDKPLPPVEVVDMRQEFHVGRATRLLSHRLEHYMRQSLSRGEQVILFLNKRGFSPFVNCPRCGYVLRCDKCDIALTYHKRYHVALCHYCHGEAHPPEECPDCKGAKMNYFGLGTERIEDEINRLFPEYRSMRMDSDTMKGRNVHERAFRALKNLEVDILIGTQMIAKGLDFPNVTLVGVISADTILNLPDFRACERTFQLLAQVAGRTGRGPKGGRVVIQSFNPNQYSTLAAAGHDYEGFADRELEYRRSLGYPPFGVMARMVFRGRKEDPVRKRALRVAKILRDVGGSNGRRLDVLGPAPAPISRIRNNFRWHLSLKALSYDVLKDALQRVGGGSRAPGGVRETIDVDPYNML
ncbi:MAG: primosomal protein N' [Candidatus Brocadiales bacterium]